MSTYMAPHTEKTFSWNGDEYYVSQLYGKPLQILQATLFNPIGARKADFKPLVFSSGKTANVESSATLNGKQIVLFNTKQIDPADLQYYAFLDTTKLIPSTILTPKVKQDAHEKKLDKEITTTVETEKLSFMEQIISSLFPGDSYLWIKKNGKWVLLTGAALAIFHKPLTAAVKRKFKR